MSHLAYTLLGHSPKQTFAAQPVLAILVCLSSKTLLWEARPHPRNTYYLNAIANGMLNPSQMTKPVCPKLCLPRPVMCVGDLWPTMPHIACILSGPSPKSLCCTTYAVHAWCVWQARPDLGKPGPTQDTHKISMHVLMACSTPASPTHIHGEIVCSRTFHQGRNTQDLGQPGTQEEIENDHWQVLQFATPHSKYTRADFQIVLRRISHQKNLKTEGAPDFSIYF